MEIETFTEKVASVKNVEDRGPRSTGCCPGLHRLAQQGRRQNLVL